MRQVHRQAQSNKKIPFNNRIQVATVNMESGEYIAVFSTFSHHPCICRSNWSKIPKTKINVANVCFASIFSGFITGKEDHYYILSLRTLLFACFLFFAWPGILLSVAALINAKKVHHSYPRFANNQAWGNQYCDVHWHIAKYRAGSRTGHWRQ